MRNYARYGSLFVLSLVFALSAFAQSVRLTGKVSGADGTAAQAVSVTVKGGTAGTYTDEAGNWSLSVSSLPVTLVFSSVGFENREVAVASASDVSSISLTSTSSLGQEVVVSATRTPTRLLESPVTVERVSSAAIRSAPAASYYDVIGNVKGVDLTTSSLTFKTPSTRGFNGSGNLRLNQLVDGIDNQAPGLNFSVGAIVGPSELDVESMELLPGASSALYGPGGMNGTLLINSKNPFRYQGLSFQVKQGVMHFDDSDRDVSPYYNWSARYAKKIGDRFAFKIAGDFISANDWVAQDYRNYRRLGTTGSIIAGTRQSDPNYDGVNVYGDETTASLNAVFRGVAGQAPFLAPFISTLLLDSNNVSRTGYNERDIVDPQTINFKATGALHYMLGKGIEASLTAFIGTGNTVYTGSDRYSLKNLVIGQYKFQLDAKNWLFRAYTTQENAGESYNATIATRLTNEVWKPSGGSTGWFAQYGQAFLANRLGGASDSAAHMAARAVADQGRPAPGSEQFKQIFDQVRSVPISKGGGLFVDKTDLYNVEGQYNLTSALGGVAEVLVGGNFKRYVLNSEGTLFADSTGPIGINEFGGYVQASRDIANRVKLTVSGRYDKNENFEGRFTPRATALIRLFPNSNLRLSYQTAYRFPSTQQQWINLNVGGGVQLIGGVQDLKTFFGLNTNTFSLASLQPGGTPKAYSPQPFKPESVNSYEVGYKGLIRGKLLVDAYGYLGNYTNFIVRELVVKDPGTPGSRIFSVPTNVSNEVKTYGFGLSLEYRLPSNFVASVNASSDRIDNIPVGLTAFFNSPEYRGNVSFGNNGIGKSKRVGFNLTYRYQDEFFFEGDFANGLVPAIHTVDAQVSYNIPKNKSIIKIGANNLANDYYRNAAGNPSIGGLYYVSYGYNIF